MAPSPLLRAACALAAASALSLSPPPPPSSGGSGAGDDVAVEEESATGRGEGPTPCPRATEWLGAEAEVALQDEMSELGLKLPRDFCSSSDKSRQQAPQRRKPVLWIHIHKSAGTTVCQLAKLNSEQVIERSYNCDWFPHDTIDAAQPISCQDRSVKFAEQSATWGAIEHTLSGPLCTKQFNYAILLRDPVLLAISKANYGRYTTPKALQSLNCVEHGDCSREVTGDRGSGGHKLWWFFDNFLVRQLAGDEAMEAPVRGVTEAHVQKAVEVVSQMQVVLFLDDLREEHQPPVLTEAFGWQVIPKGMIANPSKVNVVLSQAEMKLAKRLNARDYAVYDHFKSLPLTERLKPLS